MLSLQQLRLTVMRCVLHLVIGQQAAVAEQAGHTIGLEQRIDAAAELLHDA